ncbi:MAG TPA: dihydroorotate dehydrogenase electron transfer subunit [Syntrophorhabdaceae bacterium]|nr:dihydroorotate dehydrogenase electron transfer subunit [Syntrophorhabdaceae bacterium]
MDDKVATIIENRHVVSNYFLVKLKLAGPMWKVKPGQFVMLKVPGGELFLRRPFSIFDYGRETISIMYRVVGKGTDALSRAKKNEKTLVLGPLGNGFAAPKRSKPVVITGGIGVAGVHLLAKSLGRKARIFYGCAHKDELAVMKDIMDFNPAIATLDGSRGFKGDVVSLFRREIKPSALGDIEIFTCGPHGMVKSLKKCISASKTPCQVLMEEHMACGLGLCFGCVVKTTDVEEPYKRACKEGPVFDLWQVSL